MSGSTPAGDDELLARHVAGDRDAFAILVERHRDRLWAVALRTLGDREDAADALQDALISAYRGAAGFRGACAVTTWLHRIVVNACLDLARRRAVRPAQPLLDDQAVDRPARDAVTDRDTSLAVLAALRTLPPEQAAAVVLVDIEGYPVDEVAEMLEVPSGTVKSRCARARARLAERLADLDPRREAADTPSGNASAPRPVQPSTVADDASGAPPPALPPAAGGPDDPQPYDAVPHGQEHP